jgi:hypothetical protein
MSPIVIGTPPRTSPTTIGNGKNNKFNQQETRKRQKDIFMLVWEQGEDIGDWKVELARP